MMSNNIHFKTGDKVRIQYLQLPNSLISRSVSKQEAIVQYIDNNDSVCVKTITNFYLLLPQNLIEKL